MEYYSFVNYINDTLKIDLSSSTDKEKLNYYYSYDHLYFYKCEELKTEFIDRNVSNLYLEKFFIDKHNIFQD